VQNHISFNAAGGTIRGIHAEPCDKCVSVVTGMAFGSWVGIRARSTFGTVFTAVIDPSKAFFVPRGVGNAFQSLEGNPAYVCLVHDHWSADAQRQYTSRSLADETVPIDGSIPLEQAELAYKERVHY
jgi:dTDP-4-dehydrorhamnose 3,5-epimerase/reductase